MQTKTSKRVVLGAALVGISAYFSSLAVSLNAGGSGMCVWYGVMSAASGLVGVIALFTAAHSYLEWDL